MFTILFLNIYNNTSMFYIIYTDTYIYYYIYTILYRLLRSWYNQLKLLQLTCTDISSGLLERVKTATQRLNASCNTCEDWMMHKFSHNKNWKASRNKTLAGNPFVIAKGKHLTFCSLLRWFIGAKFLASTGTSLWCFSVDRILACELLPQ